MTSETLQIGDVLLTRVSYAEVEVEPEQVGLTAEEVTSSGAPSEWVSGAKPRASASAWIIDHAGARIVVDPAGAVDDILRNDNDAAAHQEAFAALFEEAGYPRERITHAVATHLDGIGMLAWRNDDGSWAPFFPNAPILMSPKRYFDRLPARLRTRPVVDPCPLWCWSLVTRANDDRESIAALREHASNVIQPAASLTAPAGPVWLPSADPHRDEIRWLE